MIADDRLQEYLDQLTWCKTRQEEYELLRKLIAEAEPLIRKYEREKVADWLEVPTKEPKSYWKLDKSGREAFRYLAKQLREKE